MRTLANGSFNVDEVKVASRLGNVVLSAAIVRIDTVEGFAQGPAFARIVNAVGETKRFARRGLVRRHRNGWR